MENIFNHKKPVWLVLSGMLVILVVVSIVGRAVTNAQNTSDSNTLDTVSVQQERWSGYGQVMNVDNTSLSLETQSGINTVDLSSVEKIETKSYTPLVLTDIVIGDTVIVQGLVEGSSIFAKRIISFSTTSTKDIATSTEDIATSTEEIVVEETATSTDSIIEPVATSTEDIATSTEEIVIEETATSTDPIIEPVATSTDPVIEPVATSTEDIATSTEEIVIEETATSTDPIIEPVATSTEETSEQTSPLNATSSPEITPTPEIVPAS